MDAVLRPAAPWRRRPLPRAVKPLLWLLLLTPLAVLVWQAINGDLGANPAETLIRALGDWAIRFLTLALAVTPLRQGLAWPALGGLRRLLGLFAAAYAGLHTLAYVWLDQAWSWSAVVQDVIKRPFITVGMAAVVLLLLMSVTSPRAVARRMGGLAWRRLHRGVYAVAILVVLHFWWMREGKQDFAEVWLWGGLLAALLLLRWPRCQQALQAWGKGRSKAHWSA